MYFLKPNKLYFAVFWDKSKIETLKLHGFKIYNNYFLKEVKRVIDVIELKPNETAIIDTKDNTAVVCVGSVDGELTLSDINNNYIASLTFKETHTLPPNSGQYKLYYPSTATYNAIVFVVHFFAL